MEATTRIDQALAAALSGGESDACPSGLSQALRYAVFPGGARIRPRLCLAVAAACGEDQPAVTDAAAASIELLHCASLVHDDLPCFDDAATRRGKPSVHRLYGERLAVLTGDALIVIAFAVLAPVARIAPERVGHLLRVIADSVGAEGGIAAGQAWECEEHVVREDYQRAKTGALFAAATIAGATASGADGAPWSRVGERLGEAYQVVDDIRDVAADAEELGKPTGRDLALGRPSAVLDLGVDGALQRLHLLLDEAVEAIPACPGEDTLRSLILLETQRFLPKGLARRAA